MIWLLFLFHVFSPSSLRKMMSFFFTCKIPVLLFILTPDSDGLLLSCILCVYAPVTPIQKVTSFSSLSFHFNHNKRPVGEININWIDSTNLWGNLGSDQPFLFRISAQ